MRNKSCDIWCVMHRLGLLLASASSGLTPLSPVVLRSMATKVVSSENFGKIQSFLTIRDAIEAVCALLAVYIYNTVYASTADTYPFVFWFLGAILYIWCLPMIYWLYTANKNILELERTTQVHPSQNSQTMF